MQHALLRFSVGIGPLLFLVACGASSYSSSSGPANSQSGAAAGTSGSAAAPGFAGAASLQGSNDAVLATPTVAGTVAVVNGSSRTISIVFTSNDGSLISGFGISGNLPMLPSGWSAPAGFSCGSVSVGSSCIMNLTYAPVAPDSGSFTIEDVYLDNATQPKTGDALTIAYSATANNNVIATALPSGQIAAIVGVGAQSVGVNFTTDDGNPATNLTLDTDLDALPPGWTSSTANLSCAIVSNGSGCQLTLRYAPAIAANGVLKLTYGYTDDAGEDKSGAVNIPYSATSANNLVATATPPGQIIAVQKAGGQAVLVAFTTDDGMPASNVFLTSDLTKLPAGWSHAPGSFSCATVDGGNGCQLPLTYAPEGLTHGTLSLSYVYRDGGGATRIGSLNLDYAATTNDNVTATASPSGPIEAVISDGTQPGNGSQAVSVNFITDDGRPATRLRVGNDLTALPAGWHSNLATPFVCGGIDALQSCTLSLSYAPATAGAGTLALAYAYDNNAGEAKTGSLSIAFRATTNNNVQWAAAALPIPVHTGSSNPVDITFHTDDGNPATALTMTSSLASLPAGWTSSAANFSCAAVGAGATCMLSLNYAPTLADAGGTLMLTYSYLNDAGYPANSTVTLAYAAISP